MSQQSSDKKVFCGIAFVLLVLILAFTLGCTVIYHVFSNRIPDIVTEGIRQQTVVEEVEPEPTGIVRVEGPEFIPTTIDFSFNGVGYSIAPKVDNDLYYGAFEMERELNNDPSFSEEEFYQDYYYRLTFDPEMDDAIEYVVLQLRLIRDEQELGVAGYAELIIKYVQSIPYDFDRLEEHQADLSPKGDPRLPVQTLVDGTADCDEKVMLAAALLSHEGYGTALLVYKEEAHAVLGLKGEGPGYLESGYEFVELTSPIYVSEKPEAIVGDVRLTSIPMILEFRSGSALYPQSAVDEIAFIIHARDTALAAAETKRAYIESTPMSQGQFDYEASLYEACFIAHNSLRVTVNEDGTPNYDTPFKDRIAALEWLAVNYWWQ